MLVATSTSASLLVNRNRLRKSILFQNTDGSNSVYIKRERAATPTVSASDFDHRLGPGATLSFNSVLDGTETIQDSYSVIAAAGTPTIAVIETEDFIR
jgi:hypothetical protein